MFLTCSFNHNSPSLKLKMSETKRLAVMSQVTQLVKSQEEKNRQENVKEDDEIF